jgi:hypothetical protein
MPSENELAIARFQGRHVALISQKQAADLSTSALQNRSGM